MKRIRLALMLCVAPMLLGAAPENETETPLTLDSFVAAAFQAHLLLFQLALAYGSNTESRS